MTIHLSTAFAVVTTLGISLISRTAFSAQPSRLVTPLKSKKHIISIAEPTFEKYYRDFAKAYYAANDADTVRTDLLVGLSLTSEVSMQTSRCFVHQNQFIADDHSYMEQYNSYYATSPISLSVQAKGSRQISISVVASADLGKFGLPQQMIWSGEVKEEIIRHEGRVALLPQIYTDETNSVSIYAKHPAQSDKQEFGIHIRDDKRDRQSGRGTTVQIWCE